MSLDAAVILIAHDRWFLESVATAVLELEAGRGKFFPGTWHQWRTEKAQRELALGRAIERQQAEIDRLEKFVTRFRAGTRARQAQARQKRLDKIDRIERGERDRDGLAFAFKPPERSGRVVFEFEDGRVHDRRPGAAGRRRAVARARRARVGGRAQRRRQDDADRDAGRLPAVRRRRLRRADAHRHGGQARAGGLRRDAPRRGRSAPVVTGKLRTGHNVKIGFLSQHAEELRAGNARTVLEACQHATGLTPAQRAGAARALPVQRRGRGEAARRRCPAASAGGCRWRSSSVRRQRADPRRADQPPRRREPRGARGGAVEFRARCC